MPAVCTSMALVVNQDSKSIEVLARHFAKQSWGVQLVSSAQEAVQKFQTSPRSYDLVVLELNPAVAEIAKQLREAYHEVRLIVVLAETDSPNEQFSMDPWVEVQKPLSSNKIARAIRIAFSQTVSWENPKANQMSGSAKASS
jgi:two-component SAPR family response regulator